MSGIKVNTPVGRTSFMSIFEQKVWPGEDEGEYQVTMIFDKESDLKEIAKACKEAVEDEFGKGVSVELPWKSGNECTNADGEVYEGYEDKFVLRTKSKFKPIIIDQKKQPIDSSESDRFQSGDYAIVQVQCTPWTFGKKKGVSCYLQAIQLVKQGERFGSGGADLSTFGELEEDNASGDLFT